MSVYHQKVKDKNGIWKETEAFSYRFMIHGKKFSGVCTGCASKADAEKFEKRQKPLQ